MYDLLFYEKNIFCYRFSILQSILFVLYVLLHLYTCVYILDFLLHCVLYIWKQNYNKKLIM